MSEETARFVVFACNWDGLSCVEAAAQSGLGYPASVRVVRVSCLSRLHHGMILRAFELGADGVMLLGCESGKCQYDADAERIDHEYETARMILRMLGLGEDRLALWRVSRGDGAAFARQVTGFVREVERMRPAVPARAR
jgi:coenzyme F420-reducing hydrogenase delta subunit